jgi:nucleotide-binding universal stress UspA family protein
MSSSIAPATYSGNTRARLMRRAERMRREALSPPRIMLVLDLRAPSITAVERAVSLARASEGRVDVVAVVRDGWMVGEHRAWLLARFALAVDCIASGRVQNVDVKIGTLQSTAIAMGRKRRPDIVVFGATLDSGRVAVAIAEALGIQVLVAREHQPEGRILASTDLVSVDYPVLRTATSLGRVLAEPVTYFHNVEPSTGPRVEPLFARSDEVVATAQARLRHLARDCGAEAVVHRSTTTADAIIEVARARCTDLVVLGHRPRSWLTRRFRRRMVESVATACQPSVLVVPIRRGF